MGTVYGVDYKAARGWLTPAEREALAGWAREVAGLSGVTLNIGIEFGASMHCLRQGSGLLVGVDLIGNEKMEGGPIPDTLIVKGPSQQVFDVWGAPIKLAFIDGDHSYGGVKRDCLFAGHVIPHGIIAFHDTAMSSAEADVDRAVSEWYAEQRQKTLPFFDNLGFEELPRVDSIRAFRRSWHPGA